MRVYTNNGHVTRNNLDDRSHRGYFVVYAYTTGVIFYWSLDQPFVIQISHHVLFDEYNYSISIEDKHPPSSLLLQQDLEICVHN